MSARIRLCRQADIPEGQARGFDPFGQGQDAVLVVRRGGRYFAWRDACPHHHTPMAWRRHGYLNAAGDRIVCHAHGAQFLIESGVCTLGPCLGQSLQPVLLTEDNGDLWIAADHSAETTS